jgi:hypothetical protein
MNRFRTTNTNFIDKERKLVDRFMNLSLKRFLKYNYENRRRYSSRIAGIKMTLRINKNLNWLRSLIVQPNYTPEYIKQNKTALHTLFCILGLFPALSFADLPLTVENLLTAQNRWRATLGINYGNADRQGLSAGQPITVQVGPAQFIEVPTKIGQSRINSDTLVFSPGLRYGVTEKTELYSRTSWILDKARIQAVDGSHSQSSNRFDSFWLGVNHQLIEDGKWPALLGFFEFAAVENNQLPGFNDTSIDFGRSLLIGATTYRVIDPIVLSLTAGYRVNIKHNISGQDYAPGNYLLLNPSVSFAVNNDITLSGGIQWRNTEASVLNSQAQGLSNTNTQLTLGLAWQWDERSVLNFSGNADVSGNNGVNLGATWAYKLGELPQPNHAKAKAM